MNAHKPYGPYEKYFKRLLDVVCGCLALILFCWLYLIIAIFVRIKNGSPVIFRQKRPGKDRKIFELYKFRSMLNSTDKDGNLLPDVERLTKFGKFIRATSLDELPEVLNIIKGDMSIIGPRPLAVDYLPYYSESENHRHDVRPGLSGLAQVKGRNSISWEDKFNLDLEYVNRITFLGDVRIVLMTIKSVLSRENIGVRGVDAPVDFDEYRKQQRCNEFVK